MEEVETGDSARRDGEGAPPQEPYMDSLPLELLTKIASLLPLEQQLGARRVSRRWLQAVDFNLKTLQRLHIDFPEKMDNSNLEFLLKKMPDLRSLTSRKETVEERCEIVPKTQFNLNLVRKYCPHLEEAELHFFWLDTGYLRRLVSACPRLKAIKLPSETDDACLKELLPHLTGLRSLDLSNTAVKGACFSLLPVSLDRLDLSFTQYLKSVYFGELARCFELRDLRVLGVANKLQGADLATMLSGCRRLERFSLTYTYSQSEWLRQLSHCPQLRELHLSAGSAYDVWYSDEDVAEVLIACPRLERLSLTGGKFLGSTWLRQMSQCPQLRELDMSRVSHILPADLAEGLAFCPMLERLTLDSMRGNDNGVLVLKRCLPPPGSLPALRHLSVTHLLITDGCLKRLSRLQPDLHTLQVTTSVFVSPTEEGWMACLPRFRQLQALELCRLAGVSDALLDRLHDLPLRKLSCLVGDHFTPGAISRLVSACLSLKYLYLEDMGGKFWSQLVHQLSADRDVTIAVAKSTLADLPQPPPGSIRLVDSSRVRFEDV